MPVQAPSLTIGIEEEYLLVDRISRDLAVEPPESMMRECEELLSGQVTPEFLKAQIEVGTRVCRGVKEARADLCHLRGAVAEVAGHHGLAPIAASELDLCLSVPENSARKRGGGVTACRRNGKCSRP